MHEYLQEVLKEHLDYSSEKKEILSLLIHSHQSGCMVGINSTNLEPITNLTAVEDKVFDEELWVVLRPYDTNGQMLNVTKLRLSEINSVIPFASKLENPFLRQIEDKGSSEDRLGDMLLGF